MAGVVNACLQVPDLPGGVYHVFLEDVLGVTAPPTPVTTEVTPTSSPKVTLSVAPSSARPGQVVTVSGKLRKDYSARQGYADFCWGGCPDGLQYSAVPLEWVSGARFTARLRLPAAPWFDAGSGRLVSPAAGTYPLGVECIILSAGCALRPPDGVADVTLVDSASYTCSTVPGCAYLEISPGPVVPGEVVTVSGRAPLMNVTGEDMPFVWGFWGERGDPGPGVKLVPEGAPPARGISADIGARAVHVRATPTFASLGRLVVLSDQPAGQAEIGANPASPSWVAWCTPSYVVLQGADDQMRFAVAAAAKALAASYHARLENIQCNTVALSASPGAGQPPSEVAAGFVVYTPTTGQSVEVALYTADGGASWAWVPTPSGAARTGFAGFSYGPGGAVEALFSQGTGAGTYATTATEVPLVEETTRPGHWAGAPLSCPGQGPCIDLGASAVSGCGMAGERYRPLLASDDGGQRWRSPPFDFDTCWLGSLVALSPTEALAITAAPALPYSGVFPLMFTRDGGSTWQVVSLPALPGAGPCCSYGAAALVMFADGTLADVAGAPWDLLPPGSSHWCRTLAPVGAKSADALSFTSVGGQLWWSSYGSSAVPVVHHVSEAALGCDGSAGSPGPHRK